MRSGVVTQVRSMRDESLDWRVVTWSQPARSRPSRGAKADARIARMTGFDAVVRVARLALQSSGEGVETLERYVARAASAYGNAVDVVMLPEQILIRDRTRRPPAIWPSLGQRPASFDSTSSRL